MEKLRWYELALLWLARLTGAIWLAMSGIGLIYFAFQVDLFSAAFIASNAIATLAPARWFIDPRKSTFLWFVVLAGFLGPIRLLSEQGFDFIGVPIAQSVPLALFLVTLVLVTFRRIFSATVQTRIVQVSDAATTTGKSQQSR